MPSAVCPECGLELLRQPDIPDMQRSLCPTCSRPIYRETRNNVKIICPDCGTSKDRLEVHFTKKKPEGIC